MESGEELTEEGADGQGSPARGNGKGPEGLTYLIPALARNPVTAVTIALSAAASLLWWSGCLLAIALFRESMFQEAEAAIHKADELLTPEDGDCRNSILELKHSMTDGKADSTGRSEGSDGRAGPPPPPG